MRLEVAGLAVISVLVCVCTPHINCSTVRQEPNCSEPTLEQLQCFLGAGTRNGANIGPRCQGVDLAPYDRNQIKQSQICEHLDCLDALSQYVYTPCNRSDEKGCVQQFCKSNMSCVVATDEEYKCMVDAGDKHHDEIAVKCNGVDLDLLRQQQFEKSKVCDHPQCITLLQAVMYTPCSRNDIGLCLQLSCKTSSIICRPTTAYQKECIREAGYNHLKELTSSCNGVDLDIFNKGDVVGSKICSHSNCRTALNKYIYTPCHRSDLEVCMIQNICFMNCSAGVTPTESKCMAEAGARSDSQAVLKSKCPDVDFYALGEGDLKGSNMCDHPACISAMDKYVYGPCKRHDITGCIRTGCKT